MPEMIHGTISQAGKFGSLWCKIMHDAPTWPIHGQYRCRTCGRLYPVPWVRQNVSPAVASPTSRKALGAVLPLLLFVSILPITPLHASETVGANSDVMEANTPAATAFARYIAGLETARPWNLETVEIEASLPKLKKEGRLRAFRRMLPVGRPQYRVLETAGDETVRRQVIVRYLSAEARAAEFPAGSVAVSPANYSFRYKAATWRGGRVTYIFQITPLQKREGLMKGELWLDGVTGAAVRQSGRLVKNPSIFLRRVEITREIALHDGSAEAHLTHLTVAARFLGVAELSIVERPLEPSEDPAVSSQSAR